MLIAAIKKILSRDSWIADEPRESDDEATFGILASDIARQITVFPGHIQSELEQMLALGNPLAVKFTALAHGGNYSPVCREFRQLCALVDQRLSLRFGG